jgi:uncharacterized protein GlcG (DUF336 family)
MRPVTSLALSLCASATMLLAQDPISKANCRDLPNEAQLRQWLMAAKGDDIGGLFKGELMWGAIVNRQGELCAWTTSTADPTQVWPGSQAIAKAKAYTANAFSVDRLPLSTARLYTFTQPGHSLASLGFSNPFNPQFVLPASGQGPGQNQVNAGMIFFGGGLPLYRNGKVIGGLGVSGDTACADHEVAKKVRAAANLTPPGGNLVDDIVLSPPDPPSVFAHPLCLTTRRNGESLGDERPATYVVINK